MREQSGPDRHRRSKPGQMKGPADYPEPIHEENPAAASLFMRHVDRRENFLDLRTRRFQPLRDMQTGSEFFDCFVQRKTGRLGRNLEQYATGFAKIDRMKINAIDYRSDVVTKINELFSPLELI